MRTGAEVSAGQVLGTVSTVDGGTVLETFTAPADGVILFVTSSPAVAADGLLLGLGAAVSPAAACRRSGIDRRGRRCLLVMAAGSGGGVTPAIQAFVCRG